MREIVRQYSKCDIPAAVIAGVLDESPVLDDVAKGVFRSWVEMACLRAGALAGVAGMLDERPALDEACAPARKREAPRRS